MNLFKKFVFVLLASVVVQGLGIQAQAHGPQLQITNQQGRISTRQIIPDGPYEPLSPETSAYVMPVMEFSGAWYTRPNTTLDGLGLPEFYSGPGLAYGLGHTFEEGSVLSIQFAAGLKRWDGTMFIDAGDTQLQAFRGSNTAPTATAKSSDSAPFASLSLAAIAAGYDDEAHGTIRYQLFNDGLTPSTPDDGVYLAALKVLSSQTNLMASNEFYFVLNKNAPLQTLSAAVASLNLPATNVQYVPELGGVTLSAVGLAISLMAARRRLQ